MGNNETIWSFNVLVHQSGLSALNWRHDRRPATVSQSRQKCALAVTQNNMLTASKLKFEVKMPVPMYRFEFDAVVIVVNSKISKFFEFWSEQVA